MKDFSVTNLFFVTGFSFLAFTVGLKFLDGMVNPFLLKIGLGGIILGSLSFLIGFLLKKWNHKSMISPDAE